MDKEIILSWLSSYGYGCGYGSGSGDGSGDGYGYGCGNGCGNGYGYGYGSGSGDGYGCGYGNGYGSGDGYGYGDGCGNGCGNGYGSGNGCGNGCGYKFTTYKGEDVYYIDGVPTLIHKIKGDYAHGFVINADFTASPCWVARSEDGRLFAHGKDLHEAVESLNQKNTGSMSEEEKIELFCKTFTPDEKYKGTVFFDWHNRLTGSCLFGRNQFVKNKDIDLEAMYSVDDFITIVENDYGSDIIKKLKAKWQSLKEV